MWGCPLALGEPLLSAGPSQNGHCQQVVFGRVASAWTVQVPSDNAHPPLFSRSFWWPSLRRHFSVQSSRLPAPSGTKKKKPTTQQPQNFAVLYRCKTILSFIPANQILGRFARLSPVSSVREPRRPDAPPPAALPAPCVGPRKSASADEAASPELLGGLVSFGQNQSLS